MSVFELFTFWNVSNAHLKSFLHISWWFFFFLSFSSSDLTQEVARARGDTFLSKLKLQFQRSATENTLISSQLNSPELMKLSGLPGRLIMALYEHNSVEQRYKESGGQTYPGEHTYQRSR